MSSDIANTFLKLAGILYSILFPKQFMVAGIELKGIKIGQAILTI